MKIYYKNKNRTQMIIIIKVIKRRMVIINLIMKISIDFIYIFFLICLVFSTQKHITSFDIAIANYSLGEDCNYLTAYTKTLSNCKLKNRG